MLVAVPKEDWPAVKEGHPPEGCAGCKREGAGADGGGGGGGSGGSGGKKRKSGKSGNRLWRGWTPTKTVAQLKRGAA